MHPLGIILYSIHLCGARRTFCILELHLLLMTVAVYIKVMRFLQAMPSLSHQIRLKWRDPDQSRERKDHTPHWLSAWNFAEFPAEVMLPRMAVQGKTEEVTALNQLWLLESPPILRN